MTTTTGSATATDNMTGDVPSESDAADLAVTDVAKEQSKVVTTVIALLQMCPIQ